MQRSNLGMRKGYHLSIEGIRKGYLFCLKSWFVQLQTNSFQGLYKEFSRTKIYLINRHSLPPLIILLAKTCTSWSHLRFLLLRSSLIILFPLYYLPQQDFAKWLGMTCNCIWGTEIAFETKKQKCNIVHSQKCFYVTGEFYRFLPREWAKVSSAKKTLILQKKVSGVDKVVNFKDFSFKTL